MNKKMNNNMFLSILLVIVVLLGYAFYYNMDKIRNTVEGFYEEACPTNEKMFDELIESEELNELENLDIEGDLDEHDHHSFVRKTGIYPMLSNINQKIDKKCPQMPDMSKYVLKSSLKPEKQCPDMSNYVLKTNILPEKNCPDCVCPKVNVSAGLCKKCEPCPDCPPPKRCPPAVCPEPKPCPQVECPKTEPCPPQLKCPRPQPCQPCEQPKCTGCPYCQKKNDGLLHHPNYPGSRDFETKKQNNGRRNVDSNMFQKIKNIF